MSNPVRFAIVGYGHIGRRHAEHILQNPDTELIAICDIDVAVAATAPTDVAAYTDYSKMLGEAKPDVVCVCTPNYLHEPHTVAALEMGYHVVVEKPMALTEKECDAMIAASKKAGKIIFAVKQNRYNPPVQAVKQLIATGALGKVFMIQVNCFWNRGDNYYAQSEWRGKKKMDGGCLFTQFSHFIDILYYLNGDITSAKGSIANFAHQHNTEFEDTGSFVMRGANGSMISFNYSTCAFEKNMEGAITILAEHGTVKIGGQYLNTIEYQKIKNISLPAINITAKNNDYGLYQGSMSNHDKVIQNVADVLQRNSPIMTGAEEGRDVVKIIEMMYAAGER